MSRREEVLVVHPGALGDVLQGVPALGALREAVPCRLTFAGQPRLARLLVDTAVVDEAADFDALGLSHLFVTDAVPAAVRERLARFDRAVSWFGARDAAYASALRAVIRRVIVAPPGPAADSAHPVWDHLCSTVTEWTGATLPSTRPLAMPEASTDNARARLSSLGADPARPLLVVHPGAGGPWKRWPADKLARAATRAAQAARWQVLVHEGPADAEAASEVLNALARIAPALPPLHLVAPSLDLLAGVLTLAHAYVGADSGVSHLAAAVGARAVIIYPASTHGRWAPWSPTATPIVMTDDDRDLEQVTASLVAGSR
jgi:ADP-heptose:LPS heptosyltransferase